MLKKKFTYQYIFDFFKKENCTLISTEYINSGKILKYICSCGNIAECEFRLFSRGQRCRECGKKRRNEKIKKKFNGLFLFQTEQFKEKRKKICLEKYGVDSIAKTQFCKEKRKKTCLERYGVDTILQIDSIKQEIKKKYMEKYGVEYYSQTQEYKDKLKKTFMEKHGVPSLAYFSRRASKQSQKLFKSIYELIDEKLQKKCYFASLNNEFVANKGTNYYKYDFVITENKKFIEYNGNKFHPKDHQKDDEINWCVFHPNKTVKESRQQELEKNMILINRGFKGLTVWENEYLENFEDLLLKCIQFINN